MTRGAARWARRGARGARFRKWALRLEVELRGRGGRLELEAPAGIELAAPPRLRIAPGSALRLRVGHGVRIGSGCTLEVGPGPAGELVLEDGVELQDGVRIQLRSGSIRVGAHTHVRDGANLKSSGRLDVGRHVLLGIVNSLHAHERVVVGDHTASGGHVTLVDSDHGVDGSDTPLLHQPVRATPIELGRNVYLGTNVVVLRGARVGDNAVVAAGAVVRGGNWPAGALLAGVPAQVRRQP